MYLLITKQKSGRFALDAGEYDFQVLANIARRQRPDLDKFIPLGKPNEPTPLEQGYYDYDASKAKKELGMSFIPVEQIVKDWVTRAEALGVYQ